MEGSDKKKCKISGCEAEAGYRSFCREHMKDWLDGKIYMNGSTVPDDKRRLAKIRSQSLYAADQASVEAIEETLQISLDFTSYEEIHKSLAVTAHKYMRTVEAQAMWLIMTHPDCYPDVGKQASR